MPPAARVLAPRAVLACALATSLWEVACRTTLPAFVYPDTVHTETLVALGVDRGLQPVKLLTEIPEGQAHFTVYSTLSDLRPGKKYVFGLKIVDEQGKIVLSDERPFVSKQGRFAVWRSVKPDWEEHAPGLWEISAGVGSQRTITELYVIPRFAVEVPQHHATPDPDLWFHLGVASHVTPGDDPKPVNDLKQVSSDRDRVYVYIQMHGLRPGEPYTCNYVVRNATGEIALENAVEFVPAASTWTLADRLDFGWFSKGGTWEIEAKVRENRARRRFDVER